MSPTVLPPDGSFDVRYRILGDEHEARRVADAVRVEQTIEFPPELVHDPMIHDEVVGAVVDVAPAPDLVRPDEGCAARPRTDVVVRYRDGVAGGGLPQLLNVLWGNVSLLPGVRVEDVVLSGSTIAAYAGPRFGVDGLRELLGVPERPLLATATKPMGSSAEVLAELAGACARAGIDLIKDDHGLADQPWAPQRERALRSIDAVQRANEATGGRSRFLPSLNAPAGELLPLAHELADAGAGGFLVMPGLSGLDAMRQLAGPEGPGLPIMSHPSFLGANVVAPDHGLSHGVLFGTLMRLAGADLVIFPHAGGRFSFPEDACREIRTSCAAPLGGLARAFPTPGGGMVPERAQELVDVYGRDVCLLIGGALHRGDLAENVGALLRSVEAVRTD